MNDGKNLSFWVENYDFWSDLPEMKLEVSVWLEDFHLVATLFCLPFSGYEFWQKMDINERVSVIENEILKVMHCHYSLKDSYSDYYIIIIKVNIGEQYKEIEHTVLKKTWQRLFTWQQEEMLRILALSVVEWEIKKID